MDLICSTGGLDAEWHLGAAELRAQQLGAQSWKKLSALIARH